MTHSHHPGLRAKDRAERAVRAWVSALAAVGLAQFVNENVHIPWWGHALVIASGTSVGSFGFSFMAKRFGDPGTASFVKGIEYQQGEK